MKSLIILFLISLAKSQNCDVNGRCSNSPLLDVTITDDIKECIEHCEQFETCAWITYFEQEGGLCQLYHECKDISVDGCNACVTSEVTCKYYTCEAPGLCLVSLIIKLNQTFKKYLIFREMCLMKLFLWKVTRNVPKIVEIWVQVVLGFHSMQKTNFVCFTQLVQL